MSSPVSRLKERFYKSIADAFHGSRRLSVTFKNHGTRDDSLDCLLELVRDGAITVPPHDREFLLAVRNTGDWEGDQNRTFIIEFRPEFRLWLAFCFVCRVVGSLENVEVA